ncbi:RagB/SusD family nutrient uptake outer membrane protein [Hymenobacter sp. HD11105]
MKTVNFFSILTLAVCLAACKDEFFDRTPLDQPAESTFYTDETSIRQVLNDAYFALRGAYEFKFVFGDLAADDVYNSKFNNSANHITINESNVVADNGIVNDMWGRSYATISRCNLVLDNIDRIPMNDETKLRYINEAKFLRALMYFNLVRIYGDVPLVVTDIKTSQEAYSYERTPMAQVYEQIIADLTAAEQLPASYAQNADIGRATRGAAKGLLAKVYLTLRRYSEASPKLLDVINSGTYQLLGNYADVFDAARPNNAEVIFAVQYARGFDPVQGNPFVQGAFANEDIGTGVLRRGTGTFLITDELYNLFPAADTRKATITRLTGSRRTYNFTTKYFDRGMTSTVDSGNDWIELRYADVLLMQAEVQNELGNTAAAFPYLQQVRTRAGLSTAENLRANQSAMRLALETERRLELYNEGHRWFDLARTGRLLPVMNAHFASGLSNDEIGSGNSIQPYEQLFPVPRFQVNLNPDKITQNPGY